MNTAQEMAAIVYKALDDKKAFDIKILDIKKISAVADYFVIADGTNKNQVQAMCDNCGRRNAQSRIFFKKCGRIFTGRMDFVRLL